jgi:peptide/nickel transport system permease protein
MQASASQALILADGTHEIGRPAGFMRRLLRVRLAAPAIVILVGFVLMAVFAPLLSPDDPLKSDLLHTFGQPSLSHPFGTDYIGRDMLSRVIYGSRVSLLVGAVSVGIAILIGVPVGLVSGYAGGALDTVLMRVVDGVMAFPTLILALSIVAVLGSGALNVMIAIGLTAIPYYARLARAQTLSVKTYDYVVAARALGCSRMRILAQYILPNSLAPLIVASTLGLAGAVLAEAGLGFLGVGVTPPTPTWGSELNQGFHYLSLNPWLSFFPGFAIFLLVLSFNFVGDALRDVLDPRLRGMD